MTNIKMVAADVDGTLLTDDKLLAPSTAEAVRELRAAGIMFTMVSARPPLGLEKLCRELNVTRPVAAFNGAMIVSPGMTVRDRKSMGRAGARLAGGILNAHGLSAWAYCGLDWFVPDFKGERVEWEAECTGMRPRLFGSWGDLPGLPSKIVGVSEVPGHVGNALHAVQEQLRTAVSAACSTPFYLDITAPGVDKGTAVAWLAAYHGVSGREVAVIGDGMVDTPMFLGNPGVSIAMGNAPPLVKSLADKVTTDNESAGFANAMRRWVLR